MVPPVTTRSLAVSVRMLSGTVMVSADVPPFFAKIGDALKVVAGENHVARYGWANSKFPTTEACVCPYQVVALVNAV